MGRAFKLRIPKSRVSSVPIQVPILKEFPLLTSLPTKKNVSKRIVQFEEVPKETGAVLVSRQAPVPIIPNKSKPPATRGQFNAVKGPIESKKQHKKGGRFTLAWYKLYLDSCAAYYTSFVTSLLQDVKEVGTTLHGNYNVGVTATKTKGYWGKFHMWVNK